MGSPLQKPAAKLNSACLKGIILASALTLSMQAGQPAQSESTSGSDTWSSCLSRGQEALTAQDLTLAEESFRKALALVESKPHKPADEEQCLRKLADALMLRDKTAEAQALYQRLLNNLTSRYGEKSNKLGPVLLALGSIQEAEGNHAAAMTYYQRALNINEKNYGTYSPEFADNLARAGRTSYKAGDISSARKYYKQSINSLTKQPGLAASENLKKLLKDYKDLNIGEDNSNQELIKDFKEEIYGGSPKEEKPKQKSDTAGSTSAFQQETAFKLKASTQGQVSEDPQVILRGLAAPSVQPSQKVMAPVYKTMNETIFNQSHFERGEAYYERKIAIDIQALGGEHPSVANDLSGLAVFYISKQQYEKARPLLLRALPIYEKAYGQDNLLTINTRAALASVEFHLGNTELASSLYKRALSQGQSLSPNSLETARILNDLAYLYFQQGKLQDSCTFYEWALASTEGAVGQKDPLLAACLKDYAQVLRGLGRSQEASAIESRAERILAVRQ